MELVARKRSLVALVDRAHLVATKNIKPEFEMAGRITIEATPGDEKVPDKVTFLSSNGYLDMKTEMTRLSDNCVACAAAGTATVDAKILKKILHDLGQDDDCIIRLKAAGKNLVLEDTTPKRARAKLDMEIVPQNHDFAIKSNPKGFDHEFDTAMFAQGINKVSKYISPLSYKVRYHMVCLHFCDQEIRFVCGDGMRFCILSYQTPQKYDGVKHIMPADQAALIVQLVNDSPKMKMVYDSPASCFINAYNGVEMHLKGIPAEPYIPYENHAFKMDAAKLVVDISAQDYLYITKLVDDVKDQAPDIEGSFHSAIFTIEGQELGLVVRECRYNCDSRVVRSDPETQAEYKSQYAGQFLLDVAQAAHLSTIRFYCADPKGTMIAESIDVKDNEIIRGDPKLSFFFAAALNDGDSSNNG